MQFSSGGLWQTLWQPTISESLGSLTGTLIAGLVLYFIVDSRLRPKLEKKSEERKYRVDALKSGSKAVLKIIEITPTADYKNWRHAFEDGLYFHGAFDKNFTNWTIQNHIDAITTITPIFEDWRRIGEAELVDIRDGLPDCSLKDKIDLLQSKCQLLLIDLEFLKPSLMPSSNEDETLISIALSFYKTIEELIDLIEAIKKLSQYCLKSPLEYLQRS